jgi:hypothetical protein
MLFGGLEQKQPSAITRIGWDGRNKWLHSSCTQDGAPGVTNFLTEFLNFNGSATLVVAWLI